MTHSVTRNGQTVRDSNLVTPWINMSVAATCVVAAEEILLCGLCVNLLYLEFIEFFLFSGTVSEDENHGCTIWPLIMLQNNGLRL